MPTEQMRPTLSADQISKYFDRLGLSQEQRVDHVANLTPEDALQYLSLLQKRHLIHIPFENLTLHYSAHRQVSIHADELFKKIIGDNNGRGGYCMENNGLFNALLHSLGFSVYSAGGRVFDDGKWTGWSHMVNLVTIGEIKYHVDVGFGAEGPVGPMPLDHTGTVQPHIEPSEARLQWRNISGNTDPNQRLWVYEYRRGQDSEWESKYSYTELEYLPQDYAIINYFTSTSPRTFFTRVTVVEKKIVGEHGELAGNLILMGNTLKWRIKGKKEKEIEFSSETDRLESLEKHFGMIFSQVEREGIRGLPSEIK